MNKYENFHYIFPPRPKNAIPPGELNFWENGMMVAQPKLNGSNAVIFMDETSIKVYNRHGDRLTNFNLESNELRCLYSGKGWMVLNGEYMNKAKMDENSNLFNHKLVLFDILVYDGIYLVGKTFQERIDLLDKLFGTTVAPENFLYSLSENIYRVRSFTSNFSEMFKTLTQIDMVEGLVLKRKSARLEIGTTEENNTKSQLKSRKPTKNYKF